VSLPHTFHAATFAPAPEGFNLSVAESGNGYYAEGETVTYTITDTNQNTAILKYAIWTGSSTNFSGSNSGQFNLTNGSGSFSVTLATDEISPEADLFQQFFIKDLDDNFLMTAPPLYITDVDPAYPYTLSYLVVAGGAGGAWIMGAGGGAGGMLEGTATISSSSVHSIVVGAGGTGAIYSGGSFTNRNGSDSTTPFATSIGGGGGAYGYWLQNQIQNGVNGGSGGGGAYTGGSGGSGVSGQGNSGGNGYNTGWWRLAGGGGAGGAGVSGGQRANGGVGRASSITGASVYYAGGGGGSAWYQATASESTYGGTGGGGKGGGWQNADTSEPGVVNTGGGAGSGGNYSRNGGSGIVILKVPTDSYSGTHSGCTVTTSGSYKILSFTESGSYTS
jgi:hypothetical protein